MSEKALSFGRKSLDRVANEVIVNGQLRYFLELDMFFSERMCPNDLINIMHDIFGVYIDIKPAGVLKIRKTDFSDKQIEDIMFGFSDIELKVVTDKASEKAINLFIAKDLSLAQELKMRFEELWKTMEGGKILDLEKWKNNTRLIGKMLGYPSTAVDFFVEKGVGHALSKEQKGFTGEDRYYTHSPGHKRYEYFIYDYPINYMIDRLTVATRYYAREDSSRTWLEGWYDSCSIDKKVG